MKVFSNFPHELPEQADFAVLSLGVFDGLHLGHQKILETAFEEAGKRPVALVTFDPHPRAVLGPHKHARLLSPIDERLELLQGWPLGAVAILRFDQQVAQMSYVDFVRDVLLRGLGAQQLVLGYNVRLGANREGNRQALDRLGQELGFTLRIVPAVEFEGEPISSTRIRHALDAGDVERACDMLGRPYTLRGPVVRGSGRGRVLGMPTANLEISSEKLVPGNGVYAVRVHVGGTQYGGAMNIGVAPTFQTSGARSVEVHLLDYIGDLYGAHLRLEILARLRDEKRFESPEALSAQVSRDVEAARRVLEH